MSEGPSEQYFVELKEIENKLNNNLLKYLKNGDFPETNKNLRMDVYNFVQNWGNKDEEAEDLYKYFNKVITEYSKEFGNQLKDKPSSEIIDDLIERSNRMDFLIKFMSEAFSYINFYYIKFRKCPKLERSALTIYRENLFMPFANTTLYKVLDFLSEEDSNKRKLALNVIYTLIFYCKEEILPLKDHIVNFLKVLKTDKVKEVREVCLLILQIFS